MEMGIAIRRMHQNRQDFVDDLSDLALVYVAAGRMKEARGVADELFEIAGKSLEGALWPQYVWRAIARVNEAAGDEERASAARREAQTALDQFTASISNEEWRKAFLTIDVNREIAAFGTAAAR